MVRRGVRDPALPVTHLARGKSSLQRGPNAPSNMITNTRRKQVREIFERAYSDFVKRVALVIIYKR